MRVLVAGASGILGRVLLPALLARGHEVVALTRSPSSAERLAAPGVEPVIADALDRDALLDALRGRRADAVLHELTALTKAPTRYRSMRPTNALRTGGTANLLDAAELLGATRFVTQSIVFGYGYRAHRGMLDEDAPFGEPDGTGVDPISAALADNERMTFAAPGVDGIALRYGLFYGLDAPTVTTMLRRRMLPAARGRSGAIPLIHHADAAAATVAALERGEPGRAYNIADDDPDQTWAGYLGTAASVFGTPGPLSVPTGLLRVIAPYAARLLADLDLRVSTERARAELGWAPHFPSAREGWRAEL